MEKFAAPAHPYIGSDSGSNGHRSPFKAFVTLDFLPDRDVEQVDVSVGR